MKRVYFVKAVRGRWEVWYRREDCKPDVVNGAWQWRASYLRYWRWINAARLATDLTTAYHDGMWERDA